ncbi:hypothetical protein AK812_SmicGene3034 [Symbiodinium microadriaticum]|uniref:Uncharacterized protein n=1 Tax=Symbiodinium microadriaticum TaxID=2951 RepID=A0A1Q9F076_SYMMI|nr:hypothetical protein AK812_SmicGene3034 [Symbiodinium microadriaticum]
MSDADSDGADTGYLCELENLLQEGGYFKDDDLWPAYMRCIAVSLVQFACAPLVFLCAYSGRGSAAGMTVGFMLLGSTAFQYWLVYWLVSWLKRQPCRATWQPSIDALTDFRGTCSTCCVLSGAFALLFGMIEAIDPALDAWAAANAFNLYTHDLRLKFESSWNYIPLLGWLVAGLGLPGVLLSILLFSMLCQLWFLFDKDQYVTAERLFDKFREGAETRAECRYKLWYQWKHVADLGGLLVLLGVFEKLVHAELELDTDGDLGKPTHCSLRWQEVMFGSTFPNDLSDMFVAMNLQRDAYFRLAPPLLNRFEKQIFLRKDLMSKSDEALLARVTKFWVTLNELMNAGKTVKDKELQLVLLRPTTTAIISGIIIIIILLLLLLLIIIIIINNIVVIAATVSITVIIRRFSVSWVSYHPELLSSLVFTLRKTHPNRTLDELVEIAKKAITWVLTPEAVCITAATLQPAEMQMKFGEGLALVGEQSSLCFVALPLAAVQSDVVKEGCKQMKFKAKPDSGFKTATGFSMKTGFDIVSEYFEQQRHSDLPSFAEMTVQNKVMTYSPIRGKVGGELSKAPKLVARAEVSLHELSSSTDIEKAQRCMVRHGERGYTWRHHHQQISIIITITISIIIVIIIIIIIIIIVIIITITITILTIIAIAIVITILIIIIIIIIMIIISFFITIITVIVIVIIVAIVVIITTSIITDTINTVPPTAAWIIHADPVAASVRMIEHCRFVCEKARNGFCQKGKGEGALFVLNADDNDDEFDDAGDGFRTIETVSRYDGKFSFDFDSQWSAVFLDVVEGLEFPKLLRSCFRSSLSRLMYPHSRRPDDLQKQIQLMLSFACKQTRDTSKMLTSPLLLHLADPVAGEDGQRLGNAGLELLDVAMKREPWLKLSTASLLSPLSARLQNEAISAITESATAQHEVKTTDSLDAPVQLQAPHLTTEMIKFWHANPCPERWADGRAGVSAEGAMVGTDAYTGARPFGSRFPASWFISKVIDGVRQIIEQNEPKGARGKQLFHRLSKLAEIGINHQMDQEPEMQKDTGKPTQRDTERRGERYSPYPPESYFGDVRFELRGSGRDVQLRILKKTLTRLRQKTLTSILEAVPAAVPEAELLLVHETLAKELVELASMPPAAWEKCQELYREWLMRKLVVAGLTKDKLLILSGQQGVDPKKIEKLKSNTADCCRCVFLSVKDVRYTLNFPQETLALVLQHVAYPLELPPEVVRNFARDLPKAPPALRVCRLAEEQSFVAAQPPAQPAVEQPEKIRYSGTLLAMLNFGQVVVNQMPMHKEHALQALSSFIESWFLDVCLRDAEAMNDLEQNSLRLVCSVAAGSEKEQSVHLFTFVPFPFILPSWLLPSRYRSWKEGESVNRNNNMIKGSKFQAVSGIAASQMEGWGENMDSGLNLALLRKLIVSSTGAAKATATKTIEELLTAIAKHEKHNDTLFATRYAILQEEDKSADHGKCVWEVAVSAKATRPVFTLYLEDPDGWPMLRLEDVFNPVLWHVLALELWRISFHVQRCILSMYAQILCQVDGLLQTSKPEFLSVCRSMRLYLLPPGMVALESTRLSWLLTAANWLEVSKPEPDTPPRKALRVTTMPLTAITDVLAGSDGAYCIEVHGAPERFVVPWLLLFDVGRFGLLGARAQGLRFVRGSLAEAPLAETGWVMKWRDLHDIDFEKFIGAALVPKWNPFSGDTQDLAEYNLAMTAVVELLLQQYFKRTDMGTLPEERMIILRCDIPAEATPEN